MMARELQRARLSEHRRIGSAPLDFASLQRSREARKATPGSMPIASACFRTQFQKLKATADGDGSLLDHMILLFGCGMSDGNGHTPRNLPIVVLGGATGGQKEGGT